MSNINKLRKLQDELKDAVNRVVDDFTQEFMDVYYDAKVEQTILTKTGINKHQLDSLLDLMGCSACEIIDSDEAREDAFDDSVTIIRETIKDLY